MAKFNEKISTILNNQLPEFVVADHPKFAEFLKVYYQLLESAELSVTAIEGTDGVLLETETGQTNNLVLNSSRKDTARTLLDENDKILLEESTYGKFTRGETVTGQTSKATAVVLVEDIENSRLIISAQDKFVDTEIVVGQSSGAQATISNYRPNPVNNISDLIKHLSSVFAKISEHSAATVIGLPLIEPELSINSVTTVSLNSKSFSFLNDKELYGSKIIRGNLELSNNPSSKSNSQVRFCFASNCL